MKILLIFLMALFYSCDNQNEEQLQITDLDWTIDNVVGSISDDLDDLGGYTLTRNTNSIFNLSIIEKAFATDDCVSRVNLQNCTNSTQELNYDCNLYGQSYSLEGDISHKYTGLNCTLSDGENVTRTYNYTLNALSGEKVTTNSSTSQTYNNNVIGGGSVVSRSSLGALAYTILGKNVKYYDSTNQLQKSISLVSTSLPITSIYRNYRVIDTGEITVYNNTNSYTMTLTPSKLTWDETCCHPVSGTINAKFTGTYTDDVTLTFSGCGDVRAKQDDKYLNITLKSCGYRN